MDDITYEEVVDMLKDIEEDIDYDNVDDLVDGKHFDSFDIIATINAVNEEFDITIPASEIVPQNFNSARALHALIVRLAEDE